jgi:hypothetical protein
MLYEAIHLDPGKGKALGKEIRSVVAQGLGREEAHIAGGSVKWCSHLGKKSGSSLNSITICPRNSTPRY